MLRRRLIQPILLVLLMVLMAIWPRLAQAIPSFAQQTGQPCTACHIGAFGPQLTAFGRAASDNNTLYVFAWLIF